MKDPEGDNLLENELNEGDNNIESQDEPNNNKSDQLLTKLS